MAILDDLHEIASLAGSQAFRPRVVEDQQMLRIRIGSRLVKLFQFVDGVDEPPLLAAAMTAARPPTATTPAIAAPDIPEKAPAAGAAGTVATADAAGWIGRVAAGAGAAAGIDVVADAGIGVGAGAPVVP